MGLHNMQLMKPLWILHCCIPSRLRNSSNLVDILFSSTTVCVQHLQFLATFICGQCLLLLEEFKDVVLVLLDTCPSVVCTIINKYLAPPSDWVIIFPQTSLCFYFETGTSQLVFSECFHVLDTQVTVASVPMFSFDPTLAFRFILTIEVS